MQPENLIVIKKQVRDHLDRTYGPSSPVNQRLSYHNTRHTDWVMDRTQRIMEFLVAYHPEIKSRHCELAMIAALFHDYHQPNYIDWTSQLTPKRIRRPGLPERLSADEAMSWMQRVQQYSQSEIDEVEHSILATEATWSDVDKTVIHPRLEQGSPLIARVLTLADVNGSGLDYSEAVMEDSLCLLLENNPGFPTTKHMVRHASLPQQRAWLDMAREWFSLQLDFVAGRKQRLDMETAPFGPASLQIKALFSQFDRNHFYLYQLSQTAKKLDLAQLVDTFHLRKYD